MSQIRLNVQIKRLPEGTTEPDHTYGNRVPVDKWVQRD